MIDLKKRVYIFTWIVAISVGGVALTAQPKGYLYDEENVPKFEMADPLVFNNGQKVASAVDWKKRRQEILAFFESQVYGKSPTEIPLPVASQKREKIIMDGTVCQRQLSLRLTKTGPSIDVLIFQAAKQDRSGPVFLGLNFMGNHTVRNDADIPVTKSWVRNDKRYGYENHQASEKSRGARSTRWPVKQIVEAGCSLVTVYYGDIDPDFDDGFKNGIHGQIRAGQTARPAPDEWGSIAGWGWALSRILDYIESDKLLSEDQVYVIGHSRLGKTALWAGATDQRFAGVISNDSGCGGAALSKRRFGETVKRINTSFPHWFCDNFNRYNDKEGDLEMDQHMLIALCAPRPVYVASASKDLWADPRGEFLSIKNADPVYRLLAGTGLEISEFPKTNTASIGRLSYHCREGVHDITSYDWANYIKFAHKNSP